MCVPFNSRLTVFQFVTFNQNLLDSERPLGDIDTDFTVTKESDALYRKPESHNTFLGEVPQPRRLRLSAR